MTKTLEYNFIMEGPHLLFAIIVVILTIITFTPLHRIVAKFDPVSQDFQEIWDILDDRNKN